MCDRLFITELSHQDDETIADTSAMFESALYYPMIDIHVRLVDIWESMHKLLQFKKKGEKKSNLVN